VQVEKIAGEQLLRAIGQFIHENRKVIMANVNIRAMSLACENPWFRGLLNQSDIDFCDGSGVRIAARLLGRPIQDRVAYAEWMRELAQYSEARQNSLFFLWARPGIAEKAARRLGQRYPALRITGTQHGHFDESPGSPEIVRVAADLNAARPGLVVIGLAMPLQENWLAENWDRIDAAVDLPVGAVFDYVSGELWGAPRWMTENGLEWLARLLIEPRRLWKLYLFGSPIFFWQVFVHDVAGRPLPASGPDVGAAT
jgi:N-acetylglucosaminyldiphosphoundecaprenol N-acetyl-beta-D-mannosaminyltransferase